MPLREPLGLSSGSHAQVPIVALNGFAVKKPCRSISTPLLPVYFPAGRRPNALRPPVKVDPLYLFIADSNGRNREKHLPGWELVQAMRSNNRGARALAAELLAETENGRLLVRDLRRTRSGLRMLTGITPVEAAQVRKGEDMITPYGLPVVEDCVRCPLRKEKLVLPTVR